MPPSLRPVLLGLALLGCRSAPAGEPATAAPAARVERHLACMGTELTLVLEAADRRTGLRASERAVRALEAVEARLSTWDPTSELSRLNEAPVGQPVDLSPALAADLAAASELRARTGGAFEPGIGALVRAWGLRAGGRRPTDEELAHALSIGGLDALELAGGRAVRHHSDLVVEEGAFGKGVGLDAALSAVAGEGVLRALLDLGGQVALLPSTTPYTVQVSDPRDRGRVVLELRLTHGSVATSGNSERGIVVAGERLGHVLDPRTGRPAPDFGSVTVWAADATTADAYSTALFVLGPVAGLRLAERTTTVEALFLVREEGGLRLRTTTGLREHLRVLDDAHRETGSLDLLRLKP